MRLVLSEDAGATLVEREQFTAFAVEVRGTVDLDAFGVLPADNGEVLVPAGWVESLASDAGADWVSAFRDMLRASEPYGWYDSQTGLVRAHIATR
ncbi:hypothetical protein DFJ67_4358 [Asanoa ferruginea]|uniref:Uncharacterized protein n=1 Tax=Asanoa ferruginea TaxID=53367 RepID=A0A3D9ZMA5_9ACTN|nr:hypothetical protein [Asanoa ferruginea]REF98341.1 hypothetical protein DFJ67_4358 [Asanoa ferruginea]GIF52781.1 hypothetical protein Afe04nite_73200 [Asanoa ferruginea]